MSHQEDSDQSEGSETEYADSLGSLTESMAEQLFTTSSSGSRYSALDVNYLQSFDEEVKIAERKNRLATALVAGGEGNLWWEPEEKKGFVDDLLRGTLEPKVLDIACGIAGAFLCEVGKAYPHSTVIGLDLAPVEGYLPPNCSAEIWDVTQGLPFPDGYFTVVHLAQSYYWLAKEYRYIITVEVRRVLASGGVYITEESDGEFWNAERDPTTLPWYPFEPKDVVYLERIVLASLRSMLEECLEDPWADPAAEGAQRAFSEVYGVDWVIHLGWKEENKGKPPSPSLGNHPICIVSQEIAAALNSNIKVPPPVNGVPSNEELYWKARCWALEQLPSNIYCEYRTYLAIRA